jgi:PilZ domain-containing protein
MAHARLYERIRPAGMMSKAARIIVAPKLPVITCTVVDYSAGGACLQICGQPALPERFELLYGNVKKKGRVVWRRGTLIGVVF